MDMYLVSSSRKFFLSLFVIFLVSASFLAVTPDKAEALSATYSSTGHAARVSNIIGAQTSFPQGIFAPSVGVLSARPEVQPLAARPAQATEIACNIASVGIPVIGPMAGQLVCPHADAVVDAVEAVVDCATSPMECVTEWVYGVIGGVVSWAANGVVTLVTGVRSECIPSGGSAEFTAADNAACESRIALDYFPQGENDTQRVARALADQNELAIVALERRIANMEDGEEKTRAEDELELLRTSSADQNSFAAASSATTENSVFYTPKSTISTQTFDREYGKYALIGIMLLVPMVIAAAVQSVVTGKGSLMIRSVALHLPLAVVGMIVAPYLIRTLMAITDSFSAYILADVREDVDGFFTNSAMDPASMGLTMLLPFGIVALIFAFAAMLIWFILNMREASVALISVFMPLALAASVWPALGKWIIRAIKLLVAAIISKVFIVGALSLGLGTFAGATGVADEGGASGLSFSHLMYGATIFAIAAFSPSLVMKFFDEIGDAASSIQNGSTGAFGKAATAANLQAIGKPLADKIGSSLGKGGAGAAAGGAAAAAGALTKGAGGDAKPGSSGPGSMAKGVGAGTSGGTKGGSAPGKGSLPAGAAGGVNMGGQTGSGLSVPAGSAADTGGIPAGASSNVATGAMEAPGTGTTGGAPDLSAFGGSSGAPEATVLPQQPNALATAGASTLAAGVHQGSVMRRIAGGAMLAAGHLGRPMTVAMPVAGAARGAALATKNIRAVSQAARTAG
jgi:type IV secretion system protein TrbL